MFWQRRQRMQQAGAVGATFAHADNAAAARGHARRAHMGERVEPLLIGASGDDAGVIFRRGIEVVIVIVQPGLFERCGLIWGQHAERGAGFEAFGLHCGDHGGELGQVAVFDLAPGRAHAEALRAALLGAAGGGEHLLGRHQLGGLETGVEMRRLAAIAAIFRAPAGFDGKQLRELHFIGREVLAMHLRRAKRQFGKGQLEQRLDFGAGPIVAGGQIIGHCALYPRSGRP